jgi:stringent starvation protein B
MIAFQARFSGVAQNISVPVDNVSAIYARENGHGMAFELVPTLDHGGEEVPTSMELTELSDDSPELEPPDPGKGGLRSHLKLVK